MKKTLTVNLTGIVFHIDEDAYRLLDNYLNNLRLHFRKQEGAEEIVNDIENRISELFQEKVSAGYQVITIADAEEVIARMGKPEDFSADEEDEKEKQGQKQKATAVDETASSTINRRLYRDPDNKMLGGVFSGLALYMDWDATLLRLLAFIILFLGYGTLIPIYIILWIVVPEARTAAEKLNMRGTAVTVENIGKTVTNGFEKMAAGVNNYMSSEQPRTALQKFGDALASIFGFFLKACLIVLAIIFSPVLFVFAIVFVALVIAAVAVAVGGGAWLFHMLPAIDWAPLAAVSPMMSVLGGMAGIALAGIPLAGIVYGILSWLFNWPAMPSGLKWTLFVLWMVALIVFIVNLSAFGCFLPPYHFQSA